MRSRTSATAVGAAAADDDVHARRVQANESDKKRKNLNSNKKLPSFAGTLMTEAMVETSVLDAAGWSGEEMISFG